MRHVCHNTFQTVNIKVPIIPNPRQWLHKFQKSENHERMRMSTDELAALEAKELLKGTSRRNRTRARRRG
jgi:hypothetical protein